MSQVIPCKMKNPCAVSGQRALPKQRQRTTHERILQASRGEWTTLFSSARMCVCTMRTQPEESADAEGTDLPEHVAKEILRRVQRGAGPSAWQLSKSAGLASSTTENLAIAIDKLAPSHAQGPTVPLSPCSTSWHPDLDSFVFAHSKLRSGKSMDAGGWSHELWLLAYNHTLVKPLLLEWLSSVATLPCLA